VEAGKAYLVLSRQIREALSLDLSDRDLGQLRA